jgi:hypothetical protein
MGIGIYDDNCVYLNKFREFRDGYLKNREGGVDMIEEYYRIAPLIVKEIDKKENRSEIYRDLWDRYLSVCYSLILEKRYSEALENYKNMVKELVDKYIGR